MPSTMSKRLRELSEEVWSTLEEFEACFHNFSVEWDNSDEEDGRDNDIRAAVKRVPELIAIIDDYLRDAIGN